MSTPTDQTQSQRRIQQPAHNAPRAASHPVPPPSGVGQKAPGQANKAPVPTGDFPPWDEPEDLQRGPLPIFALLPDVLPLLARLRRGRSGLTPNAVRTETDPLRASRLRPLASLEDADKNMAGSADVTSGMPRARLANQTAPSTFSAGGPQQAAPPGHAQQEVISVTLHASHPLSSASEPDPVYPPVAERGRVEDLTWRAPRVEDPYALLQTKEDPAHTHRATVAPMPVPAPEAAPKARRPPPAEGSTRPGKSKAKNGAAKVEGSPSNQASSSTSSASPTATVQVQPPAEETPPANASARSLLRRLILKGENP